MCSSLTAVQNDANVYAFANIRSIYVIDELSPVNMRFQHVYLKIELDI